MMKYRDKKCCKNRQFISSWDGMNLQGIIKQRVKGFFCKNGFFMDSSDVSSVST